MSDMTIVRENVKTQIDSINEIEKQLKIAKKIIKQHSKSYSRLVNYEVNEILRILIENNLLNTQYFTWAESKEGYSFWINLNVELNQLLLKIKNSV